MFVEKVETRARKREVKNFRAITLSVKLAIRKLSFWLNLNVYFYYLKTQTWSTTLVSCVTATTIREPLSTLLMFSSKGCGLSSTNVGNPIWNENRSKIQSPRAITPENCTPAGLSKGLFAWREDVSSTRKILEGEPSQCRMFVCIQRVVLVPSARIFLAEKWDDPSTRKNLASWKLVSQGRS